MTVALTGPTLRTERLILRLPQASDFDAFAAFLASDRSRYVRSEDLDRGKAWRSFGHFVGHWALRGFGSFVLDRDGRAIGGAGPWFPEGWPEHEFGWTLWSADAEGQGYITEAMSAIFPYAWQTLGWTTAVSYIDPENTASIRTAERLGATHDPDAADPGYEDLVYRHSPGGFAT